MNEAHPPTREAARQAVPSRLLHDLRTPLNQIIGYTEMIMEHGPGGFRTDLQKIQAAGRQLLALFEDNFSPTGAPEPARIADSRVEPPARSEPPSAADSFPGNLASGAGPGCVLIVDDVEDNRDVLSRRLERQGYTVASAENGRQALEQLRAGNFDLVLLDIMMPEMDGYEVLRQLKADESLRHLPVIMISALGELDSVVRCIELGAEDYLPKPFNPTLLKARIGACLEKKRAHDRETQLFAQLQLRNGDLARWRAAQEADLAIARTTQQAMVNSPLPELEGWQAEAVYTPLVQVGGDVYGWRQLDRGLWLFWLADATGHGVAAALFTTLVASLFDRASAASNSARGILTRVNAEFYSVLRGRSFMTACCAVIDGKGRLSFAGAGHPPLLIRRRDGTVEALLSGNTMMGIEPAAEMIEAVANLASGDLALLYTDGLPSLKSNDGERFTSKTVADALAKIEGSAEVLPRLLAQLVQRSGAQAFDDDLAAIALRRE